MRNSLKIMVLSFVILMCGCKAFMHGYTWSKAENSYNIVTGDQKNFGDRRIKYNMGFHHNSELSDFLNCNCNTRGLPNFIYEYRNAAKCEGIKLFYFQRDSVFTFEETKRGNLKSVLKEARKMDAYERETYARLKAGNKPKPL